MNGEKLLCKLLQKKGNTEVLGLLLDLEADLRLKDAGEITALHLALQHEKAAAA